MNKTDKELTVEVVNTFVEAWNGKSNTNALNADNLVDLIKCVYNTIHSLDE